MNSPWQQVRHLFERDTGDGFPDIWIEGLRAAEYLVLFDWLMTVFDAAHDSRAEIRTRANGRVALREFLLQQGDEDEHYGVDCWQDLGGLTINGVELPGMTVRFEEDAMALDYAMGADWGEPQVAALFELLSQFADRAGHARFGWAREGCRGCHERSAYDRVLDAAFRSALTEFRACR